MFEELKKQSALVTTLLVLAICALSLYLFQWIWLGISFFSDVIIILFTAWVLSFILGPFVDKISKIARLPKVWSATLIYLVFFGILAAAISLFVPVVVAQVETLSKVLPKYQASFPYYVHKITDTSVAFVDNALSYIPSVAGFLFSAFMILIVSFYFVLDKERMNEELYTLLPKKWHGHATYLQELIDSTFGSFIRMQIIFGIIAGIATWLIMTAFGVDFAASTSLIAGLLTFIPMIGGLLALIPPVAIALFIDPVKGLLVLLALLAMQQIVFNIIGPRLLGRALQLHPVIVLLSFFIGYKIAGGFGVIFAVPVFAVLFVVLHSIAHHFLEER